MQCTIAVQRTSWALACAFGKQNLTNKELGVEIQQVAMLAKGSGVSGVDGFAKIRHHGKHAKNWHRDLQKGIAQ